MDSGRVFQTGVWMLRPYCDCEVGKNLKYLEEFSSSRLVGRFK